jgi:ABC-type Zn2+ transport system substrate-binding protein/surface adhesin
MHEAAPPFLQHSSKFLDNLVLISTYGQVYLEVATTDDDENEDNNNDDNDNDDDDDDDDDTDDNEYDDSHFFFKIMIMLLSNTVTAAVHISSVAGRKVCGQLYC